MRVRQGVGLLVDEDLEGGERSIKVPARAPAGSKDEELTEGDVIALADEPTCRLPTSGRGFFHQHRFVDISPNHRRFQELLQRDDGLGERTLANNRQKVRRD